MFLFSFFFTALSWTNLSKALTQIGLILIYSFNSQSDSKQAYSLKCWHVLSRLQFLSLIFYPVLVWIVAGSGVLNSYSYTLTITAFSSVNSWILEYLPSSSPTWLMSTICFSWKVVSIMTEHTCTDQQVIFWVTTAQWTLDTNWSWQTASGVLGSAQRGSVWFFFCCVCVPVFVREISQGSETARRGKWVREK